MTCHALDMTDATDGAPDRQQDPDDPTGRLASYMARTQTALDVLALLTLWIVVVPPGDFGTASTVAFSVRLSLSAVYAIDLGIRALLSRRHWRYVRTHPLSLIVVAFPPLRVVFSFRLIRSLFRRGNLWRFLVAALVLVMNGAVVTYLYERHASGSNIHTLGEAVWWAMVTVTTVGYGDYYPVTAPGRITALFIMAIGIMTLAVLTAQVASSFVDQASRRRALASPSPREAGDVTVADLMERLARIEALLAAPPAEPGATSGEP
jgi:voltage-gated potassium channel